MAFALLADHLTPAEGEKTVRTYHCTSLSSRLLNLKAEGYLTITNKRVVFYGSGRSGGETSILQSEVPVADVSGITCFKGMYFSLVHFLAALFGPVLMWIVLGPIGAVFVGAATLLLSGSGSAAPQIILLLVALAVVAATSTRPRTSIWRPLGATLGTLMALGATGAALLSSVSGALFGRSRGETDITALAILIAVILGIYALVCCAWYARRPTMSLAIGSKGGSNTPIAISGLSGVGLYNTTAMRALTAEPAEDAEGMIRELGAMISDIQSLGDFGIQKWTAGAATSLPTPGRTGG